ncbi:deoxyribose-phosphate aldolase [Gordoniibacillus kamchatkensis]|uniref:Deoxyribose-phosphate aldolase n=1 Tax=Gordoniibacillus kamchatkensis TaxID=1590651 RepID=A0ABR5ABL6_9BACL|nr:deoxyribose-phosphate aldolase [Paenibacillus sp. VKM B-2647]KIL38287.1 deoxyribose-phosphate aldolase [Paenibacillus sp. VKM B-2647]
MAQGQGLDPKQLASYIDHTLLKADAGRAAIEKLCAEAKQYAFYSVCVNGQWVPLCKELLAGSNVKVAVVAGFPLGAGRSEAKAFEAAAAAKDGAAEIDMVLAIGSLLERDYATVKRDIAQVVDAVRGAAIVKVILETGYLDGELIAAACKLSEEAGAHFVKTSTGFGPGGATVEHVRLMRASVSPQIGVKASGGVRDAQAALEMIEAGANRLGTSSGVAIMNGIQGSSTY